MIKKIKLGRKCNLIIKKDKKFKNIGFDIIFKMDYNYSDISAFNLLSIILNHSSKKYPNLSAINQKKDELYGFDFSFSFGFLNDIESLSISGHTINPKYVEDKDLFKKIFSFLHEIIYNPNITNNQFDSKIYQIAKESVLAEIATYNDQKNDFVAHKLIEKLGDKKDAICAPRCGDKKIINKLNEKKLIRYYKKILKAPFDIYITGDVKYSQIEKMVRNYLEFKNKKNPKGKCFNLLNDNVIEKTIYKMDVNQTRVGLIYRTPYVFDNQKHYAVRYFNYILGGSISSKLAKEIREKEGLCYYINSLYNATYGYIHIYTGIESRNIDKVLKLIDEQISLIAKGKITSEEIKNAQITFLNDIEQQNDNMFANIKLMQRYSYINEDITLEKLRNYYLSVNKKDIQEVAKLIKYKTHLILDKGE